MTTELDKAFKVFKDAPTVENGWKLQQEIFACVAARQSEPQEKPAKQKKVSKTELTTERGGEWDKRLTEIVELFEALKWSIAPSKVNKWLQTWKVTGEGQTAYLCLGTDGFSMSSGMVDKDQQNVPLKGPFEGYDDYDNFVDLLVANNIEVE